MKPTIEERRDIDEALSEIAETRVAEAREDRVDREELEWELEPLSWDAVDAMREEADDEELREAERAQREREDEAFYEDLAADWFDCADDEGPA